MYRETHRPRFHFSPRTNWTNDPNGLVHFAGEYHLFFQHNPDHPVWGNMTWGHAVSPDLVHWRQLEHALHPDALGTIFSGSALVDWDNRTGFGDKRTDTQQPAMLAYYTSAGAYANPPRPYAQCLAYSKDRGRTWTKYQNNPVLEHIAGDNRDPKVFFHVQSGQFVMALYLQSNQFALFQSADGVTWRETERVEVEGNTECPDLFPLSLEAFSPLDSSAPVTPRELQGSRLFQRWQARHSMEDEEQWVFWAGGGRYRIGTFDGRRFVPATPALDSELGPNGYAAQTYSDMPDDRRVQISWMRGGKYPEMPFNQQMSFPVRLTLARTADGPRLRRWPVREIEALVETRETTDRLALDDGKAAPIRREGRLFDLAFDLGPGSAQRVTLWIRGVPMVFEGDVLQFQDRRVPMPSAAPSVRLLIDLTSVEVFLDGGIASASFCFLPDAYVDALSVRANGSGAALGNVRLHALKGIW